MNEEAINNTSENVEVINNNNTDDVLDQPLRKRVQKVISFLDASDIVNEDEIELTNEENVDPKLNENGEHLTFTNEDFESKKIPIKLKPLSKKDKIQMERDSQRIIRENTSIEFSYKPQQFKTIKEMKEMLAKKLQIDDGTSEIDIVNKSNKSENVVVISENDDKPLTDRIRCDPETKKLLNKSSNQIELRKNFDTILKEKYGNSDGLIELKTPEQYREDKQMLEMFMKKLERNVMPQQKRQGVDLVIKERKGNEVIQHNIHVHNTVKCIKVAGEIDPILSKGIAPMLPQEERLKYLTMSDRDKWKKHRNLLLVAEAEKRRESVNERNKKMNLAEEHLAKEKLCDMAKNNDGLSDDDYEWKEESASDTDSSINDSESNSLTDREENFDSEFSDDEFRKVKKIGKHKLRKKIIDSEDETNPEMLTVDDGNNNLTSEPKSLNDIVEERLNFFDIPSHLSNEDLFSESRSFVTTSSSLDKSHNLTNESFLVEQPGNRNFCSLTYHEDDLNGSVVVENELNDTVPMGNVLDHTIPIENVLDHTVSIENVLDHTVPIGNVFNDTVMEKQLEDTVTDIFQEKVLDDTVIMERTLDHTLILSKTSNSQIDQAFPQMNIKNCKEQLDNSLEMRSKLRQIFDFPFSKTDDNSNNSKELSMKTFSSTKQLFNDGREDIVDSVVDNIERDIDDVDLEDDHEVDLDRELSDKSIDIESELEEDEDNEEISTDVDNNIEISNSDNDDEEDVKYNNSIDSDEEELLRKQVAGISKIVPKDFIDEEAELSGSDADQYGPDENESDLDRYEDEDEGDAEELPSEGHLRRQIEKIHNRLEIDKDARDIRYLKELYLEDGDLHIAGAGERKRRYDWAGINDTADDKFAQYDINGGADDNEGSETDGDDNGPDLDQLNEDKANENDEEAIHSLMEKFGKHLHGKKFVPKCTELKPNALKAWHNADIDNKPTNDDFAKPKVLKKRGSLMDKIQHQVPINSNINASTMSLKSRMQQHTFTVERKQNTLKRQSSTITTSNGNNLDQSNFANKKWKF